MLVHGILSFPHIFVAKIPKGGTEPKYGLTILIPPTDPQLAEISRVVNEAAANGWPSGMPASCDCCFQTYDAKYKGKEYYDQRCSGWYALSCTAEADNRPEVLDGNYQKIIDPSSIRAGHMAWVNLGITAYKKGKGGIGGWLNGVMFLGEIGSLGMLDNKQTAEQMFAGVPGAAPGKATAGPLNPGVPGVPGVPVTPPPPQAPVHQMTAAAGGSTYEQLIAAGWNDELLIKHGMMVPPGGVKPSFI